MLVQTSGTDVRQDVGEHFAASAKCRQAVSIRGGTYPSIQCSGKQSVLHGASMGCPAGAARPTSERNQLVDENDGVSRFAVRPYTPVIDGAHRRDNDALDTRAGHRLIPLLSGTGM